MAMKLGISISGGVRAFGIENGYRKLERRGHVGPGSGALRRRILPFLLEFQKS